MSKLYFIEMDDHQVKLAVDAIKSLVQAQMDVASLHTHEDVVHLVHDSLALKRILKQIEIQYDQTRQTT